MVYLMVAAMAGWLVDLLADEKVVKKAYLRVALWVGEMVEMKAERLAVLKVEMLVV